MSEVKVNKISPRTNCGTVQLGDSGDTITIPAGATITNNGTQTGFGRTGAVDWQTTKKTANFTAVSGEGYFCDTSGGAFTLTLPSSPSAGDIVALKDYASSFGTNNLTLGRNGSNLNGTASDSPRNTNNESLTLVYVDATEGWIPVEEGTGFIGTSFISASGGTETTSGNYKIHTFTGPGTFTVNSLATTPACNEVSYMVVAGGGGGAAGNTPAHGAGGGGAGGFRESKAGPDCYTASPLEGSTNVTVTAQSYPITVGGGGSSGPGCATVAACEGSPSTFSSITSAGGGGGGGGATGETSGTNGGSGGGGASEGPTGGANPSPANGGAGGGGNNPPVSPPQGNNGGYGSNGPSPSLRTGGGGGATAVGGNGTPNGPVNGAGGAGATTSISASPTAYAGGGGGGGTVGQTTGGTGGTGGGATGVSPNASGTAATANTGGGGGGGGGGPPVGSVGTNGGSGIVVIRYKFQ